MNLKVYNLEWANENGRGIRNKYLMLAPKCNLLVKTIAYFSGFRQLGKFDWRASKFEGGGDEPVTTVQCTGNIINEEKKTWGYRKKNHQENGFCGHTFRWSGIDICREHHFVVAVVSRYLNFFFYFGFRLKRIRFFCCSDVSYGFAAIYWNKNEIWLVRFDANAQMKLLENKIRRNVTHPQKKSVFITFFIDFSSDI